LTGQVTQLAFLIQFLFHFLSCPFLVSTGRVLSPRPNPTEDDQNPNDNNNAPN